MFLLSAQIIRLVDSGENSAWHWFGVAVFAVLMGAAVVSVVKADRAIRSFEAENGRDAGRQRPVGDR
ncbi:hypothetical protein [Microbacterium testaceum]|uniref:hypothetical protein n=1 Tax=Microbacterium testaceum TaxID=2033 RepID=UPI001245241A|nr:hypothetical protein [Microbacterium testaceum]